MEGEGGWAEGKEVVSTLFSRSKCLNRRGNRSRISLVANNNILTDIWHTQIKVHSPIEALTNLTHVYLDVQ